MATKLELTQTFPADAATVRALQLDPDYIAFRGERTGATSVTADVVSNPDGSARVTVVRVLPAEVPSYARSMIGDTITVTETYHWGPLGADGTATGTLDASFSAPISCTAEMTLEPVGDSTAITTRGEYKASIPFVGGKVEDLARQQTERYLRKEESLMAEWLSR